ncbi:hypothetical protein [Actinoplanes sp. NPDC020271]|uniref:hypothetical protein n=1 Tax=Actinoplanes sp. NPDC020271 TaxID=3363896 RepID=UPI0037AB3CA1
MRRLPLLVAAVVTLLPVTLLSTTSSASAATGKLTVKTYDRAGATFRTKVQIINLATNESWTVSSFTAKALPKGKYAVITDIWNTKDNTDTLGGSIVTVPAGSVSATIDARNGRSVTMNLDKSPGTGYTQTVRAAICTVDNGAPIKIDAWNSPGRLFVISNSSTNLRFAYSSIWQSEDGKDTYMVAHGPSAKVPAGVRGTVRTASLGTVTAWARRGPAGSDQTSISFQEDNDCHAGYGAGVFNGQTPGSAKVHANAGKWILDADWYAAESNGNTASIGGDTRNLTVAAGKSYARTFFASAWGPGYHVPELTGSSLTFDTDSMFRDPGNSGSMMEASELSRVILTDSRNKVLKSQWRQSWGDHGDPFFTARIPARDWYTLQINARRYRPGITYPADMLSTSAQLTFKMRLDPKAKPRLTDVLLPRLTPSGLNLRNEAKAGGTTTVRIDTERRTWDTDLAVGKVTPRSVSLLASFDQGKTWKPMPVKKSGTAWVGTVTNRGAGTIWLRSRVTSTTGAYAQVTIARAYAVA